MASGNKVPAYRLRYFKNGRRVAAAKLRYADSYEVWRGGSQVVSRREFPKIAKRVADRRDFLEALSESIERRRVRVLARQRAQRAAAKAEAERKAEARRRYQREYRRRKKLLKDFPGVGFEDQSQLVSAEKIAQVEVPDFSTVKAEETWEWKNVKETDRLSIQVKPQGIEYKSRLDEKILEWVNKKRGWFSTYNYTLKEEYLIPMTAETFELSSSRALSLFLPHIINFFQQTQNSSNDFILRIKFAWEPKGKKTVHQGMSLRRQDWRTREGVIRGVMETFALFFGKMDGKDVQVRNYLANETTIFIRGFTLENSEIEE